MHGGRPSAVDMAELRIAGARSSVRPSSSRNVTRPSLPPRTQAEPARLSKPRVEAIRHRHAIPPNTRTLTRRHQHRSARSIRVRQGRDRDRCATRFCGLLHPGSMRVHRDPRFGIPITFWMPTAPQSVQREYQKKCSISICYDIAERNLRPACRQRSTSPPFIDDITDTFPAGIPQRRLQSPAGNTGIMQPERFRLPSSAQHFPQAALNHRLEGHAFSRHVRLRILTNVAGDSHPT